MQEGWIKLHRQLQNTELWEGDEPFDRRSAWIDLLLMANYADREAWVGNKIVPLKRGSFITSQEKLAARWQWGRQRVRLYLNQLNAANMITTETTNKYTVITIVKYAVYQDSEPAEEPADEPTNNHQITSKSSAKNQQITTDKKEKNNKKEKNKAARAHAREEQNFLDGVNAIDRRPALPGVNAIDPADNLSVNAIGSGEEKRDLAWAARLYEKKLGTFDGLVAEKIAALLEEVGPGVYERAVDRAQTNHAPRIGYVEAVARGLYRGDDFKRSQAKSGDIWGDAFKAYIGGDENGEDNQG